MLALAAVARPDSTPSRLDLHLVVRSWLTILPKISALAMAGSLLDLDGTSHGKACISLAIRSLSDSTGRLGAEVRAFLAEVCAA
jgi:hypothetical protein